MSCALTTSSLLADEASKQKREVFRVEERTHRFAKRSRAFRTTNSLPSGETL
jgi:hypothetical protein